VTSIGITLAKNLLQLAIAVVLARLLAPSGYGDYAFAMSLMSMLFVFAAFGLPGLLMREVAASDSRGEPGRIRALVRQGDRITFVSFGAVMAAGLAASYLWPGLHGQFRLTLMLAFVYLGCNGFAQLRGAALKGARRVVVGQLGVLIIQPLLILASALLLPYFFGVTLTPPLALGLTVASAAVALVFNMLALRRSVGSPMNGPIAGKGMDKWFMSALPFAAIGGLYLLNAHTDIIMLGMMRNSKSVGLYKVAAGGAALLPLVFSGVNQVLAPTMSRLYTEKRFGEMKRAVRTGAAVSLVAAAPAFLIYAVWGKDLIDWVFGEAYREAWTPLLILGVGQMVNVAMGAVGLVLNMSGHERDTLWGLGISAGLNIALNALLIPRFGIVGAASASSVAMALWNVFLAYRVRQRLGFWPTALW